MTATRFCLDDLPFRAAMERTLVTGGGKQNVEIVVSVPFDGTQLGRVLVSDNANIDQAFAKARTAQRDWAQTTLTERAAIARRFACLVLEHRDHLLDLIQLETGKSRSDALEEILDAVQWGNYLSRTARRHLRPKRRQAALPLLTWIHRWAVRGVGEFGFGGGWCWWVVLGVRQLPVWADFSVCLSFARGWTGV